MSVAAIRHGMGMTSPAAPESPRAASATRDHRAGMPHSVLRASSSPSIEMTRTRVFRFAKSSWRASSSTSSAMQKGHHRPRKNTSTLLCSLLLRSRWVNRLPSERLVAECRKRQPCRDRAV